MSLLLALYKTAIVAVDSWATLVGPRPSLPYRKNADVDTQSDKQLEDLCNSLPREIWLDPAKGGNRPARLTPDVIGKFVPRSQRKAKTQYDATAAVFGIRHARGPFPTSASFIDFFNCAMDGAAAARLCSHKGALKDEGLVFSHVDLSPRDIIVGDDGRLWLIDFGYAGFYPKWFEYVNMRLDDLLEFGKEYDTVWCNLIPFICDPYFDIYDWIGTIAPDYLP
ncbi:hypothetical protein EV421DRAFT_1904539 [Armillaria borealis]|uniref:Aminoglycoside phosphotransferase domain-containing protein n=1 Tax=Armillaria borealis TaxID=47425 RepID=A0AA39JII3_9AGAR|nr:hypothetical protein EV421DRAFT_1904539 [Armillaria borealis]